MNVALSTAQWVVGKALAPIADGLLEAWAASKNLGANIEALNTELLYVQATLKNASSRQLDGNPALEELLQKMRDSAQRAEDLLDELDYFRIHDELNRTFDTADENPRGWGHELVQTARHTAKAFGKLFSCTTAGNPPGEDGTQRAPCCAQLRARQRAPGSSSSAPSTNQAGEDVVARTGKLGNLFPCSSKPNVHDGDDSSARSILSNNDKGKHSLQFSRVEVSNNMKQIVDQLQPLRTEVSKILADCSRSNAPDIGHNRPITTSESIEPKLYGRDDTVISIINDITKGKYRNKDLTVLPIVGAGGIGKTTIAQHIYHNKEVQNHFEVVIWVCVSLNFDPVKLLEEIKQKIPKVEDEKEGSTTSEVIAERLKSKRFLLMMDDMWKFKNEDDWKRLMLPLKKSQKNGNVIMVTTRLPELAQLVKTTDHSIELGGLEPGEFRKLFLSFVFDRDEQDRTEHRLLLETGDKIMEKLKGSPLAAKTVGRLLKRRLDLNHWDYVLESKEWETQNNDHDIMPALKLSYDYLPFHLKQCFSCCALYPEDYMFTSKELIHFWVGMDILHSGSRNKTVEDIGQTNLNDLVTQGFFRKDETNGRQRYIIHDLLHNLALNVASHDCLSLRRSNVMSVQILPSVHHMSIIIDNAGDSDGVTQENFKSELIKLKTRLKIEKLQTLLIFGEIDESFGHIFRDLSEKANGLRVLHLHRIIKPVESIFHNFSKFIHLRYLLLGTVYGFGMHLPGEISTFYHLRILDIKGWRGSLHLPKHFSNLAKLRHINTRANEIFHSDISNVGKLQFLQELNKFIVSREENGFELNQLSHLVDLTELGIYNLERVQTKETAAKAKLADKIHMRNLKLQWESNNEPDMETLVLESLRPHKNLEHLYIGGYRGPSCPTWLGSKLCVKGLKSLQLDDVAWKTLPSLGKMWVLDELSLKRIHILNEFGPNNFGPITEPSFCSLKRLTLCRLERLEKWVVGDAPQLFSGLQVLTIEECPELLELPFVNNMHFLPNLREFIINRCPKLMSLPPILWTHTLSLVEMEDVGSLSRLHYSKYSSPIKLYITVESGEQQEILLVPSNLTELQQLEMTSCPPLMLSDLKMLTSLKRLSLESCKIVAGTVGDSEWPIETLSISSCDVSGKEVAQLLCGLTRLRKLKIMYCKNITLLGVVAEKQTSLPSSPGDETEETQATDLHQQHVSEIGGDDGLLLLPSNLTSCLQTLYFGSSSQLTLITPNGQNQKGGLQALRSLRKLSIFYCREFLSAYSSSSCCPFPSSLQELSLRRVYMKTLECLSNLTCLTILEVEGIELRSEVLWHLVSMGQLRELNVLGRQFLFFPVPVQDEQEQLLLSRSCKLYKLRTGDIEGFLCGSVCRVLSFSLTILHLYSCREVEGFTKEQEEALHLLTSLQELEFNKLRSLPEGLNKLTSLKRLEISYCPSLRCLPKDGLPSSLQILHVRYCGNDELKEQCRQLTIPEIHIWP
uniref:Uncharacterized protein n=1 Tax=Avena sativa TaxID=4498 RepID=A0ACD5TLJ1_AVESA